MITKMFSSVREKCPLVHNITNYVTVNDCANAIIAIGGSPIMADDICDVCDITSICNALNINIGTLNRRTVKSMLKAGKKSNKLRHPIILDPVGAGASRLRTMTAKKLLKRLNISVIRGNISEIKALALGDTSTQGVDANELDKVTENNINMIIGFAKNFSEKTGAVIAITGEVDIIADKDIAYVVKNGHPMMGKITGSGCILSGIIGAFIGANPENIQDAVLSAVCVMGICGEQAYLKMTKSEGNATFRTKLIDELYRIDEEMLRKWAIYEMR